MTIEDRHRTDLEESIRERWPGLSLQRRQWVAEALRSDRPVALVMDEGGDGRRAAVLLDEDACHLPNRHSYPALPEGTVMFTPAQLLAEIAPYRRLFGAPNRRRSVNE